MSFLWLIFTTQQKKKNIFVYEQCAAGEFILSRSPEPWHSWFLCVSSVYNACSLPQKMILILMDAWKLELQVAQAYP